MSSDDNVMIRVRGLGKSYEIAHQGDRATTLAEAALRKLRSPLRRPARETFWALRDVSFDVQRGDVVGVIGRNGAGKSTLFKVLSRIAEPSAGRVDLYGRVGSLLEVGTGFSGELTGRENIYLNGTILGMRRTEIAKRFDEIVDFSGVEKFLDTPVKRYSSGMYVRLAFAVAAHMDPEILIVDEVLAVGDQEFQNRCLGKIKRVSQAGRTVLFVSHSMTSITQLCTQAMFLKNGRCAFIGKTEEAIKLYTESATNESANVNKTISRRPGSGEYRFVSVSPEKASYSGDSEKVIKFKIERFSEAAGSLYLSAHVKDELGTVLVQYDSRLIGGIYDDLSSTIGKLMFTTPWLKPGRYWIDIGICGAEIVDLYLDACSFEVNPQLPFNSTVPPEAYRYGAVLGAFEWRMC